MNKENDWNHMTEANTVDSALFGHRIIQATS